MVAQVHSIVNTLIGRIIAIPKTFLRIALGLTSRSKGLPPPANGAREDFWLRAIEMRRPLGLAPGIANVIPRALNLESGA